MAQILEKKQKTSPFARYRDDDSISKTDIKTTFGYSVVAITVAVAAWGLLSAFVKQINKN